MHCFSIATLADIRNTYSKQLSKVYSLKSIFRSSLPVVSNLTAMNLWDGVCMFFIYASMLEFIIVNYLHRKVHHSSTRPQSADRHDIHRTLPNPLSSNGRKMGETSDCIPSNQVKDELEVRAPLVGGEDPSVITASQSNHRPSRVMSPLPSNAQSMPSEERMRAAASVFAWLRRPHTWDTQEITAQARLARSIDHVSKTVFPFLFSIFSITFFIYYALYSPAKVDGFIDEEYKDEM
ncbi:Glutamate-gated chloride channel-like protein [Leptotrombidium deliense]|uniref:Glutamate-gated chloride channel-like protein n=1 Tax=Leptotrombidium deliense TaxID=299467 RepID=A0A443SCA6_9ACAR|nr:Glutamate-gated chloride channel-like protein [Leptotrombidium deliense]